MAAGVAGGWDWREAGSFVKPIGEWTEADLLLLVSDKIAEGIHIDFKRSSAFIGDRFKAELSKDVVAFANAGGGLLVYGVVDHDKIAVEVDDGVLPGQMSAERLEDIIAGNTDPKVEGVRVQAINKENGNVAFVVDVPAATFRAPHQANDQRYYRRFEAKNLPMYDHEVRDLLRRGTTPAPRVTFSRRGPPLIVGRSSFGLHMGITNDSPEPMRDAVIEIYLDKRLFDEGAIPNIANFGNARDAYYDVDGGQLQLALFSKNHNPPGSMPVFKEYEFTLADVQLSGDHDVRYIWGYQIHFPGGRTTETFHDLLSEL